MLKVHVHWRHQSTYIAHVQVHFVFEGTFYRTGSSFYTPMDNCIFIIQWWSLHCKTICPARKTWNWSYQNISGVTAWVDLNRGNSQRPLFTSLTYFRGNLFSYHLSVYILYHRTHCACTKFHFSLQVHKPNCSVTLANRYEWRQTIKQSSVSNHEKLMLKQGTIN